MRDCMEGKTQTTDETIDDDDRLTELSLLNRYGDSASADTSRDRCGMCVDPSELEPSSKIQRRLHVTAAEILVVEELIAIWKNLDGGGRADLLAATAARAKERCQ